MLELTPRQSQILDFIRERIAGAGLPPTRAEISARFGFASASVAENHLKLMARKGVIELVPGTSRGIRLPRPGALEVGGEDPAPYTVKRLRPTTVNVPLIGRIAAGAPVLAEEHVTERYELDPRLFRSRPDFLRRVHGQSMVDAGIFDGDLAAIRCTPDAVNGQIVAFRFGEEMTLKRLRRRGSQVELISENLARAADYPVMHLDLARETLDLGDQRVDLRGTTYAIEGVFVGAIRTHGPGHGP